MGIKPVILLTNDDGINSEGLHILSSELKNVGEVYIIAPDRERSAASHSLTLHRPLRVDRLSERVFSVDGTPVDCVYLGVNGLLETRPSLVASGINKGGNMGEDILYSGTVSAAMEGMILGIPSFAISITGRSDFHFESAARFAKRLADFMLKQKLPQNTLLNVNVPNLPWNMIKGFKITRQGKRRFNNKIVEKIDPRGRKYYWIGGESLAPEPIEESDYLAVKEGYISITPLHLDLTNYESIEILKKMIYEHDIT